MTVTDPRFWAKRLDEAARKGESHRAVLDESVEYWNATNAKSFRILHQVTAFYSVRSVLDAGCGIGSLSEAFGPEISYVGVDFSPELIIHAKYLYPRREFYVNDLRDLAGFADDEFGLVFCRGVEGTAKIGYGNEVWAVMEKELLRVTKTVLVSMGLYHSHRYDLVNKDGCRLMGIASDPAGEEFDERERLR